MNRKERRKMTKKDFDMARAITEEHLASILLCVWVSVLHDDGYSYEQLQEWIEKVVDEYETIEDFDEYQKLIFDKTGIALVRTDDLAK